MFSLRASIKYIRTAGLSVPRTLFNLRGAVGLVFCHQTSPLSGSISLLTACSPWTCALGLAMSPDLLNWIWKVAIHFSLPLFEKCHREEQFFCMLDTSTSPSCLQCWWTGRQPSTFFQRCCWRLPQIFQEERCSSKVIIGNYFWQ